LAEWCRGLRNGADGLCGGAQGASPFSELAPAIPGARVRPSLDAHGSEKGEVPYAQRDLVCFGRKAEVREGSPVDSRPQLAAQNIWFWWVLPHFRTVCVQGRTHTSAMDGGVRVLKWGNTHQDPAPHPQQL